MAVNGRERTTTTNGAHSFVCVNVELLLAFIPSTS